MKSLVALILAAWAMASDARSQDMGLPPGIVVHRDLAYVTAGHERQKLDLYLPSMSVGPCPVIIWVHGGAWSLGDKAACPPLKQGFVGFGYAIASVNHRFSSDAVYPAQLEDLKAAVRWLRGHAKEFNLDATHIGAWGASSGGHLVALLGTTGEMKDFDVGQNLDQPSRVQAVVDFFGFSDFAKLGSRRPAGSVPPSGPPTKSPMDLLLGVSTRDPANAATVQRANPIHFLSPRASPFLLVHADTDPRSPHLQSELLYAALAEHGVPVRFVTVLGGGHGNGFPAAELDPLIHEFLDRNLKNKSEAARWLPVSESTVKALPADAPSPYAPTRGG
jgi:acetyl esterase/lipase